MPTETEDAYTAGFMDADGSFELSRVSNTGQWLIRCQASGTDRVVLDRLVGLYGGKVFNHSPATEKHKQSWIWRICKRDETLDFLQRITPFLTIKRERAKLLQAIMEWRYGFKNLSLDEQERLEQCHAAMKAANKRGSSV